MSRSAIYIAERGNQKNTSFLIFSSLSNLYQPQCAARGAGFVRTQRLIDWIPSPHDEAAAKLNMCPSGGGATDEGQMWKRRFPYEQYNKWSRSRNPAEKRGWTEALEKWGPKRVEAELSDRALGSSARINIGETRGVVVGFIRDGLVWREQHQINWAMLAVILAFTVGIAAIGISIFLN